MTASRCTTSAQHFAPAYHFLENTADRNGQLGIRVTIFDDLHPPQNVDDQGGNEAKLNGDPAECSALGTGQSLPPAPLGLSCSVAPDVSELLYNGSAAFLSGTSPTVTATLVDTTDLESPIVGADVNIELGSQSCTATTDVSGGASCTFPALTTPLGPRQLTATYAGDAEHLPATDAQEITVFAFPDRGAFTLGDVTVAHATPTTTVTWWGGTWYKHNTLSGGSAPAFFNGFARDTSPSPPNCAGTWKWRPGIGSDPPTTVPSYMGVLVISRIVGSSSGIGGNVAHIAIVKTNGGYQPHPEFPGTGTIVTLLC